MNTIEEQLRDLSARYSGLKEKYVVLKESYPDAVRNRKRVGVLMQYLSDADEYVRELEETVRGKNVQLALIKEQMKGRKEIELLVEGAIILAVDGRSLGTYVSQATHMKKIEEIKKLQEQIKEL